MPRSLPLRRLIFADIPLRVLGSTFALGLAGGSLAHLAGVPLGMLIGSLLAVGGAAAAGLRIFGAPPAVPLRWRDMFIPVIGVAIGATVPPDPLAQAAGWWVTLAALVAFVPVMHALGYLAYRRLGGLDPTTAFFAAMPGGLIEAITMGDKAGAEPQMLVTLQFLRIVLCIVSIPLAFALVTGQAVGSAAVAEAATAPPLTPALGVALVVIGAGGWWLAHLLRLPAPVLIGPLLASAVLHATGVIAAAPPDWAVLATQWVVGTSLGTRFAGMDRARLWLGLRLAVLYVAVAMSLAVGLGLTLADAVGEPVPAVILAFAPGGISEMSLVAVSLQLAAVYVTLHHVARIVLAVLVLRLGQRWLPPPDTARFP